MSIRSRTKEYGYATVGTVNSYGENTLPTTATGTIMMAISLKSATTAIDSVLYSSANYIGITTASINDKYIIFDTDNSVKYKVLYVQKARLYNVCWMEEIR